MDTDKKKKYQYYIVKLSHPINKDEKFIYVPESWVIHKVDGITSIIIYPRGVTEAVLERMKSDMRDLKDNAFKGWATMVVNVKHKTDNREFAKKYTKKFNKRGDMLFQNTNFGKPSYDTLSFEETSSKPEPVKSSQTGKNNEHGTFKATVRFNTKTLLDKKISNHLSLADSYKEKNHKLNADETASFTETPTKHEATPKFSHFPFQISKDQKPVTPYNTKESSSIDIERNTASKYYEKNKPNDKEDQSKILNRAYLNIVYLQDLYTLRSRLNDIFEDLTSLDVAKVRSEMKEIFKKLDNSNNQYSDEPFFTSSQEPTLMELEEKDVDEGAIEPARDEEKSQIFSSSRAVNEIVQEIEYQQFSKPKSNKISQYIYKNDTKWTLRYREKAEGLVELEQGSGVYVSEEMLFICKSQSMDSSEFARRLLQEVFSDSALSSCCLYGVNKHGHKMPKKLGLDSHAIRVLFTAVKKHAREQNWEIDRLKIEQSIRGKLNNLRKSYVPSKH